MPTDPIMIFLTLFIMLFGAMIPLSKYLEDLNGSEDSNRDS